jgi:hypothetical protein
MSMFSSSLFPSGFPTKILHAFFFSHIDGPWRAYSHRLRLDHSNYVYLSKSTIYEASHNANFSKWQGI